LVTLGIDSSDDFVSVGLAGPTGIIISRSSAPEARNKNILHHFLLDVLRQTETKLDDVQGVAVAIGPGSFTGLRVGLAVAKGICWSLKLPLAGISSLLAVARCAVFSKGRIMAVKDARRNEFYYTGYLLDGEKMEQMIPDAIGLPQDIIELIEKGFKPVGPGIIELRKYAPKSPLLMETNYRREEIGGAIAMAGQEMIAKGNTLDIASAAPRYIRVLKPREWKQ
jgi:tRNA threonylcarbamoyladenosine biosynthesis protein TsaB